MMLPMVLISAAGAVVFERSNDSIWVREIYHFGGGNPSFDRGKWCIYVRENVVFKKKLHS
jgi:hypothetical protein